MSTVSVKPISITIKFAALAIFCAFIVLIVNHYFQLRGYAENMSEELNITVFLSKNCKDDAKVCDAIEALGFVTMDEYVKSDEAYNKAIEKNPFLKEISIPQDSASFQSYIKVKPSELPTGEYLVITRNAMAQVDGVDEIVFDSAGYSRYVEARNILSLYQRFAAVFAIIVLVLLIVQSVLFILEKEGNARKLAANAAAYLIASSIGFVAIWSICIFSQYPLVIDETAAFYIIPLTAAFGVIFKD